jgi:hypothetical protein
MKQRCMFLSVLVVVAFALASAQVTLQPWVQVYGTVPQTQLGEYVLGITPSASLPYRAAVSDNPNTPGPATTRFLHLASPSDTAPAVQLAGSHPLIGDLNDDGISDLVIVRTVNAYDTVYIYWGTVSGLDTLNPLRIPGENQYDKLVPACMGDINNDGKTDLILSAWDYPGLFGNGRLYIFLNPVVSPNPDKILTGDSTSYHLGQICSVADLNNDGLNDLVVRGNQQSSSPPPYDYVNIYWGVAIDSVGLALSLHMRTRNIQYGLACFDVNGDGIADLLLTAADTILGYQIYMHYGGASFDTIPSLRFVNPGVGDYGYTIANAGDMNGDGYNDIAVGCPQSSITDGTVLIYGGGPEIDANVDAGISISGDGFFGAVVSSLGDITGDGLADIIIGGPEMSFLEEKGYWGVFKGDSTIRVSSVREDRQKPRDFELFQNYPNPFNPSSTIRYELPHASRVSLKVYNTLGQEVATLVNEAKPAGVYTVDFDAGGFASGVYYARLTASDELGKMLYSRVNKLLLMK